MASRWSFLALEAHCRRAIDFAEEGGPYRRLKEDLVFDRIEDHLATETMELAHAWHASAAAADPWDGDNFEFHRKAANKIYRDIGKLKLPWYKRWTLDDVEALTRLIRQFFAQERDPEFREWRDKVKKEMHDKIERMKQERVAIREVGEALKKAQAEREQKAREAHERRKARARRPVRGESR